MTKDLIKNSLKVGEKIKGKSNIEFEILKLDKNVVLIKSETSKPWKPSYNKIINSFENEVAAIGGSLMLSCMGIRKLRESNDIDIVLKREKNLNGVNYGL